MSWWDKHKQKEAEVRDVKPCEKCKTNKWKTVKKNEVYLCRKCGITRTIKKED